MLLWPHTALRVAACDVTLSVPQFPLDLARLREVRDDGSGFAWLAAPPVGGLQHHDVRIGKQLPAAFGQLANTVDTGLHVHARTCFINYNADETGVADPHLTIAHFEHEPSLFFNLFWGFVRRRCPAGFSEKKVKN